MKNMILNSLVGTYIRRENKNTDNAFIPDKRGFCVGKPYNSDFKMLKKHNNTVLYSVGHNDKVCEQKTKAIHDLSIELVSDSSDRTEQRKSFAVLHNKESRTKWKLAVQTAIDSNPDKWRAEILSEKSELRKHLKEKFEKLKSEQDTASIKPIWRRVARSSLFAMMPTNKVVKSALIHGTISAAVGAGVGFILSLLSRR